MLTKVTASVLLPIAIVALGLLLRIIPPLRKWAIFSPTAFYVFVYFIYAPVSLTVMLSFRCKESCGRATHRLGCPCDTKIPPSLSIRHPAPTA